MEDGNNVYLVTFTRNTINTTNCNELNLLTKKTQRANCENGLSILSLNCQSLPAIIDYIKLLKEKFVHNNCFLQEVCLQETWIYSGTGLSPDLIPGYHLITTPHYASTHVDLVIYLSKK